MTDANAIRRLREQVESGGEHDYAHDFLDNVRAWRSPLEYFETTNLVHRAYNGSIDAAKALHEALLPGYFFRSIIQRGHNIWHVTIWPELSIAGQESMVTGKGSMPARAWLIAILRALEGGEA